VGHLLLFEGGVRKAAGNSIDESGRRSARSPFRHESNRRYDMKWSFTIGRVFGIPIRVHITFFLLLVFVALVGKTVSNAMYAVLFVIFVFICVILHELSHSVTAIHYGHKVRSITLLPIGGMSQMEEIPEDPKEEIVISIMGPVSSIVIALIFLAVVYFLHIPIGSPMKASLWEGNMLVSLFWINLFLAGFNLIPAFPMDGGRVLRGILGVFMDHMKATRIAVFIGQMFAVLLFFVGIFYNIWLALIAVFIYLGAEGEERIWALRYALADAPVKSVMQEDFKALAPGDTLGRAAELFLHTLQGDFPILFGNSVMGILRRDALIAGINEKKDQARVADFAEREFMTTTEREPLVELYKKMAEKGISMVPVMRGDDLVGIVTMEPIGRYHMIAAAKGAR
jgi:Zn-dependent protease